MPQGTVKSFDPSDGSVVLMDDQLRILTSGPGALVPRGNTLELRIGQRVRYQVEKQDGADVVTRVDVITL